MIPLLMMLSCAPKAPPPVADAAVAGPRTMAESRPSGVVYEGVFTDEMYAFSIPVQEGWVAEAGPETGLMRVSMSTTHTTTITHTNLIALPICANMLLGAANRKAETGLHIAAFPATSNAVR